MSLCVLMSGVLSHWHHYDPFSENFDKFIEIFNKFIEIFNKFIEIFAKRIVVVKESEYYLEWELHGTPSNKRGQSFVPIGTRAYTFAKLLDFLIITIV